MVGARARCGKVQGRQLSETGIVQCADMPHDRACCLRWGWMWVVGVGALTIELVRQRRWRRRVVRRCPVHVRCSWTLRGLHDLKVSPLWSHEGRQVERQWERAWVVHPATRQCLPT